MDSDVITAADAALSFRSNSLRSSAFSSNLLLLSAFLSFSLAQFLNIFSTWYKEKSWDSKRLLSGGMPSSHSATVTSLAVSIGLQEGIRGPAFALAVVLVMYDATGVRLHASRQAEVLNQIVCELPPEHPASDLYEIHLATLPSRFWLVGCWDLWLLTSCSIPVSQAIWTRLK